MDSYALYITCFFGGFLTGAGICYMVLAQIYKHKRVRDELLKAKRSAVRAQRTLDRFLKTSLDIFGELDSAHRLYVQFLKDTAQRINPQESEQHSYLNARSAELPQMRQKDTTENKHSESKKDLEGTLESSQNTPNVLKSAEIPEIIKMQEIKKSGDNLDKDFAKNSPKQGQEI